MLDKLLTSTFLPLAFALDAVLVVWDWINPQPVAASDDPEPWVYDAADAL